ncbi:MAG: DUF5813 family protein [Halobacteriota archaeon]
MTELPDRVRRAFRDDDAFEALSEGRYESVTTHFEGRVSAAAVDGGRVHYRVTVRVPMLSAVTEDEVAPVVEDGWYETFELRVKDAGGVTRGTHDFEPSVRRDGERAVVEVDFEDLDERRAVDDARALIDFVEGTYVQGIIPGYQYEAPVTELVNRALHAGDTDVTSGEPVDR